MEGGGNGKDGGWDGAWDGVGKEQRWKWDGNGMGWDGGAVQRPCADPIAAIAPMQRPSPAPHAAPHAAPQRRGVDKAALGVTACKYCSPAKHSAARTHSAGTA